MKKAISGIMPAILICFTWACTKEEIKKEVIQYEYPDTTIVSQNVRVPAEWETHQATWMQWALDWEASMRPAFADIIEVVKQYEPLHLIAISQKEKEEAIEFLQKEGVDQENITWHVHEIDNS